jgi:ferredoxin-nitrite reductase
VLTVDFEDKNNLAEPVSCPGLFCPTIAADGVLTRIRIPAGQVFVHQLAVLAQVMARSNCSQLLITNRANVQLRSAQNLTPNDLAELQDAGLAAKDPAIDHLRNIMASPMAGLEPEIFDVMPAVREIEQYICKTPKLAALSAKFSIGLDGGEKVSVRDRSNDIWLISESDGYRLVLNLGDGEEWWTPWVSEDVVSLVSGVADRYLNYANQSFKLKKHRQSLNRQSLNRRSLNRRSLKPRLRDVIEFVGKEEFLGTGLNWGSQAIESNKTHKMADDLIYSQSNSNLITLEIICPLGKLTLDQINGLVTVLEQFGLDQIRLTPWQTLMIPNVLRWSPTDPRSSSLNALKTSLTAIPLNPNPNHPARNIIACSGKSGCQSAATHAQEHAEQLIVRLAEFAEFTDRPYPTIQISGCEKLCAHPKGCDINLIGQELNGGELYGNLPPDKAIAHLITQIQSLNTE